MQSGASIGMQTMDSALMALVSQGQIEGKEAYLQANNKAKFERLKTRPEPRGVRPPAAAASSRRRHPWHNAALQWLALTLSCPIARARSSSPAPCPMPTARCIWATWSNTSRRDIWVRFQQLRGTSLHLRLRRRHPWHADHARGREGRRHAGSSSSPRMQAEHERDFAEFGVAFDHYHSTHSAANAR